jgi:glycosyltransferase involved in cell wall biosynthesis
MRIALMVRGFDDGGVERTLTNLAVGLAGLGVAVDVLTGNPDHSYVQGLPGGVGVVPLSVDDSALAGYLSAARPDLLMTGKLADDRAALAARDSVGGDLLVVATVGTPLSVSVAGKRFNSWRVFRESRRIRADYRRLDGITAVSEAVAADLRQHFAVSEVPLRVLCNPIVPHDLRARAARPCPHPWLAPGAPPVVVAVGGLRKVKDFATLLRAFARLPADRDARLLVLGEGKERDALTGLARQLGINARVDLHGFVDDPFPYLARARALVLSSRREGLSNVLVEAMALGTPVAATDCPGGVRGLLDQGRLGPLTPVGDAEALAVSIDGLLRSPTAPAALVRAAEPFGVMAASRQYLAFFEALVAGRGR